MFFNISLKKLWDYGTPNVLKTFQECQHYEDANFTLNEV